jgi:cell division protein FtsI (penicillin-binding protein 3)
MAVTRAKSANQRNVRSSILLRVRLVFLGCLLLGIGIIGRMFYLQQVVGNSLREKAKENLMTLDEVPATRGNIYAGDGNSLLATSLPSYQLAMDPTVADVKIFAAAVDSLADSLAMFYKDVSKREYVRKIKGARAEPKRYLIVNSDYIDYQDKKRMLRWPIIRLGRNKGGVIFEKTERRERPFGLLASRTLGNVNQNKGGSGIEYSFNDTLAGKDGLTLFRRMGGGLKKPIYEERQPIHGYDLITTIDINLQDVAETALERELKRNGADYGCAVLMEVATGEIKAMANLGLDLANHDTVYRERLNYAVLTAAEPGSTMKLASYLALLQDNRIKPTDSVFCDWGSRMFGPDKMSDSKPGGYGFLSIEQAFAYSSNVAISKLANQHFKSRPLKYMEYMDAFGLTSSIDFQLKGHVKPLFYRPGNKQWNTNTLPWMSVGYNCQITPLQTLTFYNAVANNGVMVEPRIVKEVRRADKLLYTFPVKILRPKIADDKPLAQVRKLLEAVVDYGTAKNIRQTEYRIAGKTGTAKKLIGGRYTERYYASFAGYFPAEKPKYSCIVIIDNPSMPLYGADVAAPVFRELASKIYAQDVEMHKELSKEVVARVSGEPRELPTIGAGYYEDLALISNYFKVSNHNKAAGATIVRPTRRENAIYWERMKAVPSTVPDVRTMMLRDALPILENAGYTANIVGKGRVVSQSPSPGTPLSKRSIVTISMGS